MKRARIGIAITLFLTAGCTALIGVPDLELQDGSDAAVADGAVTTTDGSTSGSTGTDGSSGGPGTDASSGGVDSAACTGANLQTDNHNCGACANVCGANLTCAEGTCQQVLIDNIGFSRSLSADATYLYFSITDHQLVQRVKKDGSAAAEIITSTLDTPVGVAVNNNVLYIAANPGVYSCSVVTGATSCSPTKIAPNADPADDVGTDLGPEGIIVGPDGLLYWTDDAGDVFRSGLDGSNRVTIMSNIEEDPYMLAIGGGNIYVTTAEGTTLLSAQIDGGAVKNAGVLDSYTYYPNVTADATSYAWAYIDDSSQTGRVFLGDNATRTPTTITADPTAAGHPEGVAMDAKYVYWTDIGTFDADGDSNSDGTIKRCPRSGCNGATPTVVATGMKGGGPILLDDSFIYAVESNDDNYTGIAAGRIRRFPKPQ